VDWYVDKLPAILIFKKLALCHRPTPLMSNLLEALSSRAGQRNQNWRMSVAIHRDRMLHIGSTASFRFRSTLAYDFGLLLFRPLEVAIREHTVKFVSVVSKASVASDRRGFRNELSVADSRGRTLKDSRFIVPIRLDDVTLDEFPAQLHQLHHIDFSSNWGEGYLDLIRSLEKMGVTKDASADSTLFEDWRRISESASNIVEVASEPALTNLVQIVKLPRAVNVFSYQGDQDKFSAALRKTEVPCAQFYRLVITFSDIVSLQESLPEHFRLSEHSSYGFEEFIDGTDKGATRPKKADARNMATAMLRANIERHLSSRGLREFSGKQAAYFFPRDLLPNNKVFYQLAQGKRTWKAVVGRSEKMGVFWHLAMKVNVTIGEDPLVRFKPYICWSEC
ncbi:hypothetical protein O9X80_21200, partial [Agrobacterium salinitolerans]|uniref:hypothetical protein n=1 Tax=Agrobacterium salinitolerans TaxID=1183413 RepID=UPI0022B84DE4